MENIQPQLSVLAHALGWALLHSLWQGLVLYGLLYIALKLMPGSSSRVRYNLSLIIFSASFIWFIDTLVRYWQSLGVSTIIVNYPATGQMTRHIVQASTQKPWLDGFSGLAQQIEILFPAIIALYISGLIFFLTRFCYNFFTLQSWRRKGVSMPPPELLNAFYMWKDKLGINRNVKLLLSRYVNVPMMIGAIKPVILIPLSMSSHLSPLQLEAILIHELAHIRRNDYLVNMLQTCIETIMFFNPFVWRISSVVRNEREHCCDDIVVAATEPLAYASALAAVETHRQNPLALAASGHKNQLLNRIKRMMEMKKQSPAYSIIPVLILIAGLSLSVFWLAPALAQSKKVKDKKETTGTVTTQATTAKTEIVVVDEHGKRKSFQSVNEMTPAEREKVQEMLDEANEELNTHIDTKELDKAMAEAQKAIKEVNIDKTVKDAMKQVDWDKINKDVNVAMAMSGEAIKKSGEAMAAINWDSIGHAVELAVQSSASAIEAINWDSIEHIISTSIDSAKKGISKAKANIGTAKASSRSKSSYSYAATADDDSDNGTVKISAGNYERMLSKMEKDGLINRKEPYKVQKKKGALYIDGERQSDETYAKYRKYLDVDNLTIAGDKNSISINSQD